jgi:hypothetical protein
VLYGGGVEELDRFGVRDAIRAGDLTAESELAIVGSDDWRMVATFPEFGRYLEIAAAGVPRAYSNPLIPAKPPRIVLPMRDRIIEGLLYPVRGGEALMLIGLALLNALPGIRFLASLASTLIMVEIIRTSAEGRTKMPMVDTTQMWQLKRTYVRVLFVTLVSLLPVVVVIAVLVAGSVPPMLELLAVVIALGVAALYFPACLATVAVWDSILDSLNPAYVLRVIRRIGSDYFVVVGMWFAATLGSWLARMPAISPLARVPILGSIFSTALSLWALFYVAHLLGYAVYRHAQELGWE